GVEPPGVRTDDGAGQAAVPALPEPAELVGDHVVADVAPVTAHRVVLVDRPHDRRYLLGGVVVAVSRVVDRRGLDGRRVLRPPRADLLVGAPLGAAVDRRHGGGRIGRGGDLRAVEYI